jgi:hypothetical protein
VSSGTGCIRLCSRWALLANQRKNNNIFRGFNKRKNCTKLHLSKHVPFFSSHFMMLCQLRKLRSKELRLVYGSLVPRYSNCYYIVISETLNLTACCTLALHKSSGFYITQGKRQKCKAIPLLNYLSSMPWRCMDPRFLDFCTSWKSCLSECCLDTNLLKRYLVT